MHKYDRLGVMLDMSRNGVMTVSQVKNYIDILEKKSSIISYLQ